MTAPAITPAITGKLGKNGYHTSDVKVAWKVEDPDSPVTKSAGCADATVTADTAGQTFTCVASSNGGKASQSVTIKRDATAPTLTVPGTIIKEGAAADGAVIDYTTTATDPVNCSPASGTQFPVGRHEGRLHRHRRRRQRRREGVRRVRAPRRRARARPSPR